MAGCDRSTVMLWDPSEQALTVRGATGPGAEAARADHTEEDRAGYRLHRDSTSLFEKVMRSHDLVVVDLDTDDETVRSVLEATGNRMLGDSSALCVRRVLRHRHGEFRRSACRPTREAISSCRPG